MFLKGRRSAEISNEEGRKHLPDAVALVDEGFLVGAVRTLLEDGLVEVAQVAGEPLELVPVRSPQTDGASLRRYWYRPTDAGERVWCEGHAVLDAYWEAQQPSPG